MHGHTETCRSPAYRREIEPLNEHRCSLSFFGEVNDTLSRMGRAA